MNHPEEDNAIYGIHAVKARLRAGIGLIRLVIREGPISKRLDELQQLAGEVGCPVERGVVRGVVRGAARDAVSSHAGVAHQGVALYVTPVSLGREPDLVRLVGKHPSNLLLLMLDGITDPGNLGACLRSAATMRVDAVVLPRDHSAPLNHAALKAASGGASLVPLIQIANLGRTLTWLKEAGIWIVGTAQDASAPIHDIDLTGNIAIIMGSEGDGMRRKTRDRCDFLARIPMDQQEPGLNVSVATGICLYEARQQRQRTGEVP